MNIELIRNAYRACKELSINRGGKSTLSLFLDYCWAYMKHGCVPSHYVKGRFYMKSDIERADILTYKRAMKIQRVLNNPQYIHLLEDKAEFNKKFSNYIKRDWLDVVCSSFNDFELFMNKHHSFLIKPKRLLQGKGIRKYVLSNSDNIKQLFDNLKVEDVLIEEIISQHEKMFFGNTSVNTIRVMSMLDKTGKCHILKTVLRVGVGNSLVDNYCAGGCIYGINEEMGIVESKGQSKLGVENIIHPQSDIIMLGYKIPYWNKVIELIKEIHPLIPECRFVGWDVAITKEGVDIIEGNHNPDYELYEFVGKHGLYKEIKQYC